jgi:hypothetical protein
MQPTHTPALLELHARALMAAAVYQLAPGLSAALAAWQPASDGPLRVGFIGARADALIRALQALPLPPRLELKAGDGDLAVLVQPAGLDLLPAARETLAALKHWDIPHAIVLAEAERETDVPARVARIARQAPGETMVLPSTPGPAGMAGLLGLLWSWEARFDELAAVRDTRTLARLLDQAARTAITRTPLPAGRPDVRGFAQHPDALKALAALLPGGEVGQLASALDALGASLGLFRPALPALPAPAGSVPATGEAESFETLAREAHALLIPPPAPPEDLAALGLLPLLTAFAEAGFQQHFAEALPVTRPRTLLLLAPQRVDALRLLALLWHDLGRVAAWQAMPADSWLVCGPAPDWLPWTPRARVTPPTGWLEGLTVIVPPTGAGLQLLEAIAAADVVAVERDPRAGDALLPAAWLDALKRPNVLHVCGAGHALDPEVLATLAREADATPTFVHADYDARHAAFWRLARAGAGLVERWSALGLSFAPPFTLDALQAVDAGLVNSECLDPLAPPEAA